MSERERDPVEEIPAAPAEQPLGDQVEGDETPVLEASTAGAVPEDAPPVGRSDALATGVAVLVMAALLGCAALVLIAAGNA